MAATGGNCSIAIARPRGLHDRRMTAAGAVVNVISSAKLVPMALVAVYMASKAAVEGFTTSLAFELEALEVRVKLVEGYAPSTRFASSAALRATHLRVAHAGRCHDHRGQCRAGGMARGHRLHRPGQVPRGCRRGGAGRAEISHASTRL